MLDPYQGKSRGTDDAINTIVHLIVQHLENPKAYAGQLFIDFSSAFSTIKPLVLLSQLNQMVLTTTPLDGTTYS